jgi:hypothetical protein
MKPGKVKTGNVPEDATWKSPALGLRMARWQFPARLRHVVKLDNKGVGCVVQNTRTRQWWGALSTAAEGQV